MLTQDSQMRNRNDDECLPDWQISSSVKRKQDQPSTSTTAAARTTTTKSKKSKWLEAARPLHEGFAPRPHDVICARGKKAFNHPGNKYFRTLVQRNTPRYAKVTSKIERSIIVTEIIDEIRSNKGCGFVKFDGTVWVDVGELLAREKAGQLFRNSLSTMYRSSVKSKKLRRKDVTSRLHISTHVVMTSNTDVNAIMQTMADESERRNELSDEDIMALFTYRNQQMLHVIKNDNELKQRFATAETSSSTVDDDDDDTSSTSEDFSCDDDMCTE